MDLMQTIRKNIFTTIVCTIVIAAGVFSLSTISASLLLHLFPDSITVWWKNVFFKLFMLIYSLVVILILNKGKLRGFGLNKSARFSPWVLVGLTALITILSMIFGTVVFIKILAGLFPQPGVMGMPKFTSIVEMVLTVWIFSSLAEEIFIRGLLQSIMSNLKGIRALKLSLSVWLSGLLFGMMHFSLLSKGINIWFVLHIVFFTSSIGVIAAWYRERYDSVVPAFFVHFFANVVGSLPMIIMLLIR